MSGWARLAKRAKYTGFRAAAAIVPLLPASLCYRAAVPIGVVAYALTPTRHRGLQQNLAHVLRARATRPRLEHLARRVYVSIVRYYVDLLRSTILDVGRLKDRHVRAYGYEVLLEAQRQGRGVVLVTAHLGCPELVLQAARAWGVSFFLLIEQVEPPELFDLYLHLRSAHGHRLMPVGLAGVKEAIRTLRHGGTVLLVVDRDIQGNGVVVPFFGAPARLPTGAVELARLTGAAVHVTVCRRLPDGSAEVFVEPSIDLVRTGDRAADLKINVARIAGRMEPYIRRDLDQWMVLDPIWQPDETR